MNILVLSDIDTGGEWIVTQTIVEELKKKKKNNFYLAAYGNSTVNLKKKLFRKIQFIKHTSPAPPFRYYRQIILEFINALKKLNELKKSVPQIDCVLAANEYQAFLASYLLFPSARKIFSVHGLRHSFNSKTNSLNLYLLLRMFLERFAWLISHRLIVPSERAKETVRKELGITAAIKKIEIIPNIIADNFSLKYSAAELANFRKKHQLPNGGKIFLYCGRIDKVKGIENLLQAYILLQKQIKKTILIIAYTDAKTDWSLYAKLQAIIKDNKISKSVFMIKNLPRSTLPLLYQNADYAVFPSNSEMDSLALREALASGTPTFSTDTGNAKNLLDKINTNLILEDNAPKTITKSLIKFLKQDSKLIRKTKTKIYTLMREEFKNDKSIEAYEKLFR